MSDPACGVWSVHGRCQHVDISIVRFPPHFVLVHVVCDKIHKMGRKPESA